MLQNHMYTRHTKETVSDDMPGYQTPMWFDRGTADQQGDGIAVQEIRHVCPLVFSLEISVYKPNSEE